MNERIGWWRGVFRLPCWVRMWMWLRCRWVLGSRWVLLLLERLLFCDECGLRCCQSLLGEDWKKWWIWNALPSLLFGMRIWHCSRGSTRILWLIASLFDFQFGIILFDWWNETESDESVWLIDWLNAWIEIGWLGRMQYEIELIVGCCFCLSQFLLDHT